MSGASHPDAHSDAPRPDTRPDAPRIAPALRATIMADPGLVLDDTEVMRALVSANERLMGPNIVDLRGLAMDRLEARLDRLEDTHRSVIAAAYDNLAGTNQIHRALLRLLEPTRFEAFLRDLGGDVAAILRVESLRLVLEAPKGRDGASDDPGRDDLGLGRLGGALMMAAPGFVEAYLATGRAGAPRAVLLRPVPPGGARVHGGRPEVRSEACLRLDLGPDLRPGMLVLGSRDPHHFAPGQGTDLLAFFGAAFERILRRWLA